MIISEKTCSEKELHKKERGGGMQEYFAVDNYVSTTRSSILKKALKQPLYFHWSVNMNTGAVNSTNWNPTISTGTEIS